MKKNKYDMVVFPLILTGHDEMHCGCDIGFLKIFPSLHYVHHVSTIAVSLACNRLSYRMEYATVFVDFIICGVHTCRIILLWFFPQSYLM